MKPIEEIIDAFAIYMADTLPALLTTRDIESIESFQSYPPDDVDKRTLATYMGTGNHDEQFAGESFMMQVQLPRVLDPKAHHTEICKAIIAFDASKFNTDSLGYTYAAFYPGEIQDGGMSSFLIYEIVLEDELDDCRDDSDY